MTAGGTGWRPDRPDERDALPRYQARPLIETRAQESLELLGHVREHRDQGPESSCVGQGIALQLEMRRLLDGHPHVRLSAHGLYWPARARDLYQDEDAGSHPRSAFRVAQKVGVPSEAWWPSRRETINVRPDIGAEQDGLVRADFLYQRILGHGMWRLEAVLDHLQTPNPGGLGLLVSEAFDRAGDDTVPPPKPDERGRGLHWVTLVGFDRSGERLIIKNSWDPEWGTVIEGVPCCAYLAAEWLEHRDTGDVTFLTRSAA